MSGLFGGGKKATTHATRAMGIDFQGAQYGPVVPVVYGQNKVPGNCIWYGDFQSHAQQQKSGKGGGGGGTTNYTYSASAQMGLCEGPGITLQAVMDGTSIVNLSSINYAFASGAIGQAPWSHLSGSAALGYSLTAIFSFQNLDLGSQASLPNYNYVVGGLKQFGGSLRDANPKDILSDICSDPNHGVNFPYLGDLTQYNNYCVANTLLLSPVYDQQQSANQVLSDLFKYTNTYVYYSEDQLKVVPLGDTAVTGNGVTFTPNVTPIVNLGTDDFLADGSGATITIDRQAPQDNLNLVRVEFKDASNTYHDSAVVAAIDEDIITNGGRSDDSETVNGCTTAAVARFIAQNLVQRAFYVRNTYQFKLPWRYCYLEPTDIVTLTDAALGLSLYPVRITEIEEDGGSLLTITAEEFPEGIGHSAIYDTQPNGGTNIDQNADPGAVNPPFLFRGPGFLVGNNTPEIWCAVNGSDPMWAGCEVYLSHDGSSYTFCGTVASQARYGELTTALPAGTADPDVTHTPTVQVYAPAQLLGGSQTDADNFVTLAMIDTEIVSYETATLAGANTYTLGYLRRGGYGSANVAHAIGADFVRLDDSIFRMPVDPSLIGSTVYLKFLSINAFGRTSRTLAEETAYQYVVGTNVELPDVPDVPNSFAVLGVADGVSITWSNDNPAAVGCTSIEYSTTGTSGWTVLAQEGPTTTNFHHGFTNGATYYYRARARGPLPQSGWSAYTDVFSSTGVDVSDISNIANTALASANVAVQSGHVQNPNFLTDTSGWSFSTPANFYWQTGAQYSPYPPIPTYLVHAGTAGQTLDSASNATLTAVSPGQVVTAGAAMLNVGANAGAYAYAVIDWFDKTGAYLSSSANGAPTIGPGGTYMQANTRATGVAPANTAMCRIRFRYINHTSGQITATGAYLTPQVASIDEVPDGPTYGRMKGSSLTGNDFDFAKGGVNRNMGYMPDGGGRYGVHAVDGNNLALVDFSQAGHVNKTLDYIADTGNYARRTAITGTGGDIEIDNAQFTLGSANSFTGWGDAFGTGLIYDAGATPRHMSLRVGTDGSVGVNSNRRYGCKPGDVLTLTAYLASLNGAPLLAGIAFYDHSGTLVSNPYTSPVGTTLQSVAKTVVVPATAESFSLFVQMPPVASDFAYATIYSVRVHTNDLRVAGSGATIGDQRNLLPVTWAGVRSVLSTSPISYSISGTTVSFSVAAVTVNAGGVNVSYSASSGSVSQSAGTTVQYYLYYRDPTSSGGSKSLYITTSVQALAAYPDIVLLGSASVTVASGGGGSGGTGGGGGGLCVADDMWIRPGVQAGDADIGDPFDCLDLPTQAGKHVRALQGVTRGIEECVRIITDNGCALVCSVSTPFDLPDGRHTLAPHMLGEQVITDLGVATVSSLALIGPRPVTRAHLGGVSYAAGADPQRRIYSHNAGSISKP